MLLDVKYLNHTMQSSACLLKPYGERGGAVATVVLAEGDPNKLQLKRDNCNLFNQF